MPSGFSYQELFEAHPQPMWVLDPASLRILLANEAAARCHGYDLEAFLALGAADLLLPGKEPEQPLAAAPAGPLPRRHRRRDGGLVDLELTQRSIAFGAGAATLVTAIEVARRSAAPAAAVADLGQRSVAAEGDARLWALLDAIPAPIWSAPASGELDYANRILYDYVGTTPERLPPHRWPELVHPDDRERAVATAEAAFAAGRPYACELRLRNREGDYRWHIDSGAPLRDGQGRVVRYYGTVTEVHAIKEAEAALREVQQRNELILAATADGIHGTDTTGRIVFENRAALRMLGYEASEMFDRDAHSLIHHHRPDGTPFPQDECPIQQTVIDGQTRHVEGDWFFRKDGTGFPVEYDCAAMTDETTGLVTGAVVSFRDVTAKRREEALAALEIQVLDMVSIGAELADVLELIARTVDALAPEVRCSILLVDGDGRLRFGAAPALPAPYAETIEGQAIGEGVGSCGTAAWRGERIVVADARSDPLWRDYRELAERLNLRGCLSQPIADATGRVVATFAIYYEAGPPPTALEGAPLARIGQYVRTAIERHRVREALEESEERFRSLAEHIQLAFWMTDPDRRRLLYVSPAYVAIWGRPPEPLYEDAARWLEAVDPRDRERVARALDRLLDGGYDEEYRILRPDGGIRWVSDRAYLVRDAQGGPRWIVGNARDVTARKRAELALRERLKELRCLYGVLSVISDQTRSLPELCRATVRALPSGLLHAEQAVARLALDGEEYRAEGWSPPVVAFAVPLHRGETPVGLIEIGYRRQPADPETAEDPFLPEERDMIAAIASHLGQMLDSREMAARLARSERLSAIGQLTGGVAHDFNNLLTVVLGNAEVLSEQLAQTPTLRALSDMIAQAAQRGAELTGHLLAFARRQPLDPRVTDVNCLIAGMRELLFRILGEHIDIALDLAEALPPAMVDASQLESAILNLCLNARDAMAEGGTLTITTRCHRLEAGDIDPREEVSTGSYVAINVIDSGAGMDRATADRAFEPFFTTKDVGKGSGLGLSMVYGFARQSKGLARIVSSPGRGTSVTLFLPQADSGAGRTEPRGSGVLPAARSETILLVEDDDLVRAHVQNQLESLGYGVTATADAGSALVAMQGDRSFDLLFSDVVMPGGMSGLQLADAVRRQRPDLPVLLTSGYADEPAIDSGPLAPGLHFLPKPYSRHDLSAKVRGILDGRGT